MVETIESTSTVDIRRNVSDSAFTVPVIFVEDEVNDQIIDDHYSPSVRSVEVTKPSDATSGFGFHLSRSKWDPYPYISRVDKDSFASSSGLREGDCLLEVKSQISKLASLLNSPTDLESDVETKRAEDSGEGQ